MRYIVLLWPHANARYQSETVNLARAELALMLEKVAPKATFAPETTFVPGAEIAPEAGLDMPMLAVDFPEEPSKAVLEALRRHSLLYALFEAREGLLKLVAGRRPARVGSDLPAILKYKGKTNEMFLQLLINVALYSGDFWQDADQPLSFLDPMCGRATGLFVAANLGWNATGADVDRNDLREAEKFFKRYLEYHRFKHDVTHRSRTLKKGQAAECRFDYAADADAFRAKDTRSLSLVNLDASQAEAALGKNAFHVVACDLPYGVRHDAQLARGAERRGNWLETLLMRALPAWGAALKPGGTVAVSFNAQNMSPEKVRGAMEASGFEVLRGGPYDGFSHWVEQAITRDIAVCRKRA